MVIRSVWLDTPMMEPPLVDGLGWGRTNDVCVAANKLQEHHLYARASTLVGEQQTERQHLHTIFLVMSEDNLTTYLLGQKTFF